MRSAALCAFAWLALGAPSCAHAQAQPVRDGDAEDVACMEQSVTDAEYDACAAAWAYRADVALADALASVRAGLSRPGCNDGCSDTLARLDTAQSLWTTWRRADCDAIWQLNAGGSIRNLEFNRCMAKRALTRAAELRADF